MRIVTVSALIALLALLFVGCASTSGTDKAANTSMAVQDYLSGLLKGKGDIDRVVDSLNQLAEAKGQLKPQFDTFKTALNTLESQAAHVRSIREGLEGRKNDYIEQWNANNAAMKDEDLRKASEKQRDEVLAVFQKLATHVTEGNKLFDPYMSKLNDIAKYLDVNLNAKGIAQITAKVKEIAAEAGPIKAKVDEIKTDLKGLLAEMSDSTSTDTPAVAEKPAKPAVAEKPAKPE